MRKFDKRNYSIGQRIRAVRVSQGITQEALSVMVELGSAQQISDIERGMGGLSLQKIMEICIALDVDADYLLFGHSSRYEGSPLNRYLSRMTPAQAQAAERIVAEFAKSHGIE